MLLKLTNSITSNLDLKEVMRAIANNVREVMRCDAGIQVASDCEWVRIPSGSLFSN